MVLNPMRTDEMNDFVTTGDEELRDEAAVAAPPGCLGAHEARRRLDQRGLERLLPFGSSHPRGVAPEGRRANAAEALLAGFAGPSAAELQRVPVGDGRGIERLGERLLVELWVPARARESPNVDQRLGSRFPQALHELLGRPRSVPNRQESHVHTIAALR